MKTNKLNQSLKGSILMIGLVLMSGFANAQLGGIKIKNPINGGGKTETSSTTTSNDETPEELVKKGDAAYEAGNYKDALAYYEKAEEMGYSDGEMKMKMNECRAQVDGSAQKNEEDMNKQADESMNQLEKLKYTGTMVEDNGMTNELHTANVGKIVFSKTEIVKDQTSPAQFVNSFNMGDDIYARIYLARSMENEKNLINTYSGDFRYRITIDGNAQTTDIAKSGNYPIAGDGAVYSKWTTFQIGVAPKQEDVSYYPRNEVFVLFSKLWKLPAGSHTIKIEAVFDVPEDNVDESNPMNSYLFTTKFGAEKVLASGEFTINISDAGKILAGKKMCPAFEWMNNHTDLVPDAFAMVSKATGVEEKILKVVIANNDWTYNRNGWGVIISRHIFGKAIVQDIKTKLCYELDLTFQQENISSGGMTYGSTTFTRSGSLEENNGYVIQCFQ